jgi:pSer/pThr/pTyr-binding forkhead associated (FHA) protein
MRRESPVMSEVRVERPLLVWHPAKGAPVEYEVWQERPLTIGRDGTNTIVIDSPFVSKSHAIVSYTAGQYTVEDLQSANGTRLNGAPIAVSVLTPGDVLEVGDQRLVFSEGKTAGSAGGGLSKNTKLALTAIATLGVFGVLFALLLSSGSQPAASQASATPPTTSHKIEAGSVELALPIDVNSTTVREVLARAQQAGIKPIDALFDEANVAVQAGRLREATQLFGAVLQRDPKHESAERRFAEARAAWAQGIVDHASEAERAFDELRFNDAILEWGKVLLLTEASDKRHQAALEGVDRAKKRMGNSR